MLGVAVSAPKWVIFRDGTEVTPQYKRIHYSTGKWQQKQQQHSLQEEPCLSATAVFAVSQLIRLERSLNRFQQKFSRSLY